MSSDNNSSDYDKQQWQAKQAAHDAAMEKQRDKERKTRERAARNAQRKLERLHRTLTENGEISDFEDEFGQSVLERLDKFGSAFHDREKGRPGDALSFAQKSVVAAMNKKVKSLKKTAVNRAANPDDTDPEQDDFDDGYERTAGRWKSSEKKSKKYSSFSSKKTSKFAPRVRHIEDDFEDENQAKDYGKDNTLTPYEAIAPELKHRVPYLPEYIASSQQGSKPEQPAQSDAPKRPFLRLVK